MGIIHKRPTVVRDLEDLAFYISENNPSAALSFLKAAEETLVLLSDHPKMGVERSYNHGQLMGMRMFPVKRYGNFLLFYLPLKNNSGVDLVRVLRGSRDMSKIFE